MLGRKTSIARPDLIHRVVMQQGRIVADVAWAASYENAIVMLKDIVNRQKEVFRARTANTNDQVEAEVIHDYGEVTLVRWNTKNGRIEVFKRTFAVVPDLSLSLRDLQERHPNAKLLFTFPDETEGNE